jgi:serine/threonine protein kinase
MPYQRLDGKPLGGAILGVGRTGLVILRGKRSVLKIPAAYINPSASTDQALMDEILAEQNCSFIENEKQVYTRLGHYDGIVNWITLSDEGIEMDHMRKGSLSRYLQLEVPSRRLIAQWIPALARTVNYAHSRYVILGDIASRNALLGDDMSIKLCDFTDSALMPLNCDMSCAEDNGISVQTDIFQLGSLWYEILTRKAYKYDLFANEEVDRQRELNAGKDWELRAAWPRAKDLPTDVENLPLGQIILKCWTRFYQNMDEVCDDVDRSMQSLLDPGMAVR